MAQGDARDDQDRPQIEGRPFFQWWDEMRHSAVTAATGQQFRERVERDHNLLARNKDDQLTIVSAAGSFTTVVDRALTGAKTDEQLEKFLSTINRAQLPTHEQARQTNDMDRVKEFWNLSDKNAEAYKSAIEQAGYVLARQDNNIRVVTPAGIVDDLQRLTPAITARGDDISDYKKFVAALDLGKMPSVAEACGMQSQKQRIDPGLEALQQRLAERQERERRELAARQNRRERRVGDPPTAMVEFHQKEHEALQWKHADERARYIADYHRARRLKAEVEQSRRESLERGPDQDKPEFTR